MKAGLDHILFAASELERGCDAVEAATGVRPVFGGVHPGRGTCNALASLGPDIYLEVIAPDPEQSAENEMTRCLGAWGEPALAWWASRAENLSRLGEPLSRLGFAVSPIKQGARSTLDGQRIEWSTLYLGSDLLGAATPFLIDWGATDEHPSETSPRAGEMVELEIVIPDPEGLRPLAETVGFGPKVAIRAGDAPRMTARIAIGTTDIELSTPAGFPPAFPPRV